MGDQDPQADADRDDAREITLRGMAKVTLRSLLSLLVMLAAAVSVAERHRLKEVRTLVS